MFRFLVSHDASPGEFRGVSAQSASTKGHTRGSHAPTSRSSYRKATGETLSKTHLPNGDDNGTAAADFLLDAGSDALATAATTPRPEHEATGAESACIGGRGIYERRLWQQTRRVPQSLGRGRRGEKPFGFAKRSSAFFVYFRGVTCSACISDLRGKRKENQLNNKNAASRHPPLGANSHARAAQRRVRLGRDSGPGYQARDAVCGELETENSGRFSIEERERRQPFFVSRPPLVSTRSASLLKLKKHTNERCSHQDPSVHPRWTGDASAVASEDGRLAKFARKFEGGVGVAGSGAKKVEEK